MAETQELPPPAPELAIFEKDVGTWDAVVEFRPAPGAAPQLSRGVSVNRLIAGGRWLVCDFRNETSGFEGHGVYGWDAVKKRYTGVWVDPVRPFLAVLEGRWDERARSLSLTGEAEVPGRRLRWREVRQAVDADTQVFRSLYALPDGGEFEVIKMIYRRRRN